ncbi:MAG: DUF4922 domain-containing protein [Myxococcota bacterium]
MSDWNSALVDWATVGADPLASLGDRLPVFLKWQAERWPRLAQALEGLGKVRTRSVMVAGAPVQLQFNPGRAVNSTAKVDPASIAKRKCFLCPENLPPEEKGIPFGERLILLANPGPILEDHFVLAHREHRPQNALEALADLVEFAQRTDGAFTVIYNGPTSGASAPDHLHLQAVRARNMPLETRIVDALGADGTVGTEVLDAEGVRGFHDDAGGRTVIGLYGAPTAVERVGRRVLRFLSAGRPDEARLNLIATALDASRVLLMVVPRAAHRPQMYFASGDAQRLVSPGAIDMGGVIVTVREQDFERLSESDLQQIFSEVSRPIAPDALRGYLEGGRMTEPHLRVGLAQLRTTARLTLPAGYAINEASVPAGVVDVTLKGGRVTVQHESGPRFTGPEVDIAGPSGAAFVLHDMTVGVDFHWEHDEDLSFDGRVSLESRGETFDVVNTIGLEAYLKSVISSEMSADAPKALLEAHAIISRSWLLAQLAGAAKPAEAPPGLRPMLGGQRLTLWYDREDHLFFDVCADDHCQRYQGVTRTSTAAAVAAVEATRGRVLTYAGEICDARFSKACGGMTEVFESAWGDEPVPYLQACVDWESTEWALPLTDEANADAFIRGSPPAFCNTTDRALLDQVLPKLDHETTEFYRWEEVVTREQVREWVKAKAGVDLGPIQALKPVQRGPSGRLTELAIIGEVSRLNVGKELEIRRILSDSHLYSSAFVIDEVEGGFRLRGAGWGHGVGLCQIGAAVMASRGYGTDAILAHYFRGAVLETLY